MTTLRITALRQFSDARAERLRRTVPETITDLVAVANSSALTMTVCTADERTVLEFETASNLNAPQTLAAEVGAVLHDIGTVESAAEAALTTGRMFTLVPVAPPDDDPFDDTDRDGWKGLTGTAPVWADTVDLVRLITTLPGVAFRVEVERAVTSRPDFRQWMVTAGFVSADGALPLRLTAWVHRCLPGFSVAELPADLHDPTRAITVPHDVMLHLLRIPVTAGGPLPGMEVAPPALVPMIRRPAHNGHEERGAGIRAGRAFLSSGRGVDLVLTERERRRHLHVFGRTGTGKSSLLAGLVRSLAVEGDGALVLDPHGTLVDRIVAELPESALDRTWVIRAHDVANPVPINPMAVDDPVRRDIVIQDYQHMFHELFDPQREGIVGPRFEERLGASLRMLVALRGPRASLLDVPLLLADQRLMAEAVAASDDLRLKNWYENDKEGRRSQERGELISWFNSKWERFLNNPAVTAAMETGADAFSPAAAMDSGRIILVDLSKGKLGEVASRLLGFLYISRFWQAALQRRNDRTFTVLIDEVQSFSSSALPDMLSEGRKFGLSVILCHQYLAQLDRTLTSAVTGNVGSTAVFRTSLADAGDVSELFEGAVSRAQLVTQADLHAFIHRSAGPVAPLPHSLVVDHNDAGLGRTGDELQTVRERLRAQTLRDLVEPHRGLRTLTEDRAAVSDVRADGVGRPRTNAFGDPPPSAAPRQRPRPPHAQRPATGPSAPRSGDDAAPASPGSFLDEWLRKRQAAQPSDE